MKHHGGDLCPRAVKLTLEKRGCVRPLHYDWHLSGDLDRAIEPGEPAELVRPDERPQRQRAIVRRRIDRLEVTALALDALRDAIQRRRRVEEVDEPHGRMLISPSVVARFVAIAIPPQVQA